MNEQDIEVANVTQFLERAQQALSRGDPVGMLDALAASSYLDGLVRSLQKQWAGSLPPSEIDDCIAGAVDAACSKASAGQSIINLGAWLWKTAMNIADDKWRLDYSRRKKLDDVAALVDVETDEMLLERLEYLELEEVRRKEAVRIAREFLPQIGDGQVRDVMELVIDAVENKLPDLPASFIAEALGISKNAARALVSRGLDRFRRLAKREGVEIPTDLQKIDMNYDEQEYDNG